MTETILVPRELVDFVTAFVSGYTLATQGGQLNVELIADSFRLHQELKEQEYKLMPAALENAAAVMKVIEQQNNANRSLN